MKILVLVPFTLFVGFIVEFVLRFVNNLSNSQLIKMTITVILFGMIVDILITVL